MDKRWSFDLIRFCRLGGFAMREKVFCFSLLWVLLQGGECLYTVILWVAVLVRHCNTILLLIDQKKKKALFHHEAYKSPYLGKMSQDCL